MRPETVRKRIRAWYILTGAMTMVNSGPKRWGSRRTSIAVGSWWPQKLVDFEVFRNRLIELGTTAGERVPIRE